MKALSYLAPTLSTGFHFLTTLPPAWIIIGGALLLPFLRLRILQQSLLLVLAFIALAAIWMTTSTPAGIGISIGNTFLRFHTLHPYTRLFATAFTGIFLIGILITLPRRYMLERMAICFCAGAAIGVVYCGDLISLASYLQLMAASFIMLFCLNGNHNGKTAHYYGIMHMTGSAILLTGIMGLSSQALEDFPHLMNVTEILAAFDRGDVAPIYGLLIMIAFIILGFIPSLFLWIADSYKTIPLTGKLFVMILPVSVVIFILLTCYSGCDVCLDTGLVLTAFGLLLAIAEHRPAPLIYHLLICQTGLILTGIGIGTVMADNGVAILAVNMILSLPLLFLTIAVINSRTPEYAYATKPHYRLWLILLLFIGAFSAISFPYTPGYTGRILMMMAVKSEHLESLSRWLSLTSASLMLAGTIKLLWLSANKIQTRITISAPSVTLITLFLLAALTVITGIWPEIIKWMLPYGG